MGSATSGPSWTQQTQKYCGHELNATNSKTGVSKLLYLGDSFAQPRSAGSIDIVIDAFSDLYGSDPSGNYNDVMNPVLWEFTGMIDTQFTAPGAQFSTVPGGSGALPTSAMASSSATALSITTSSSSVAKSSATGSATPGGEGANCDGISTPCQSPYICLSPTGIYSLAACDWG